MPTTLPDLYAAWGLRVDTVEHLTGVDSAVFSADGRYRYALTRSWAEGRMAVWVMLNPSIADAFTLDPTIRRCVGFSRRWGCGGLVVLNLFALRATDPRVMRADPEPVGERNDDVIAAVAGSQRDALWVAGWGGGGSHRGRDVEVRRLLADHGVRLHYLRLTKAGDPGHPLYVHSNTKIQEFEDKGEGQKR